MIAHLHSEKDLIDLSGKSLLSSVPLADNYFLFARGGARLVGKIEKLILSLRGFRKLGGERDRKRVQQIIKLEMKGRDSLHQR